MTDFLQWLHESWVFFYYLGLLVLQVSVAASALVATVLLIVYTLWPEWTDSDPDPMLGRLLARYPRSEYVRSEYVTRYVEDHTVAEWESSEAYRQMVLDACDRLHKDSIGQRYTANRGADHTAIFDISESEYLRLLQEDTEWYGLPE